MVRVCLRCERREPHDDQPFDACPTCRGKEWAVVDAPAKDYRLCENDRRLLRSLRIRPEV